METGYNTYYSKNFKKMIGEIPLNKEEKEIKDLTFNFFFFIMKKNYL